MRSLLDVNMLLALFDPEHMFHAKAGAWWRAHRESGWASSPTTQNGALRIASGASYSNPIKLADAILILRQWTAAPGHVFWPDDVSLIDPAVIDHDHLLGRRQITDVYLLALAVKHGGRLVTLDRGISIRTVKGATARHLAVVT
jgi:hypothetical protein